MDNDKKYCNISKEFTYCVKSHRGIMGNAKLISISNNKETYYGRFSTGDEVISIGYETSQNIYLMLKYFLENKNNSRWIGENSYLINWFSDDISNSNGLQLTGGITTYDDEDLDLEEYEDESISLGGNTSKNLNNYLTGRDRFIPPESKFYVMIIDKISNGRVSIKYFRELYRSDLYKRVEAWYHSTKWGFYSARQKEIVQQSPSIYTIADYILGTETEEKNRTTVVCNNKKMRVKTIERLIPCIIDGKKIPLDLVNRMFNNLCKRSSYGKTWSSIVQVGCSLLKKYKLDYKLKDEVKEMLEENNKDRSYLYGRLLAIYEKLEADTLYSGTNEVGNRSTNAERLWTAYTKTPARTLMIWKKRLDHIRSVCKKVSLVATFIMNV